MIPADLRPGNRLIDQDVLVHGIKLLSNSRVGIFPQFIFCPGKIRITEEIEVVFSFHDLVKDKTVTAPEYEFAPHFQHIHIRINKKRFCMVSRCHHLIFKGQLAFCNMQEVVIGIIFPVRQQVFPGKLRAPGGLIMLRQ